MMIRGESDSTAVGRSRDRLGGGDRGRRVAPRSGRASNVAYRQVNAVIRQDDLLAAPASSGLLIRVSGTRGASGSPQATEPGCGAEPHVGLDPVEALLDLVA